MSARTAAPKYALGINNSPVCVCVLTDCLASTVEVIRDIYMYLFLYLRCLIAIKKDKNSNTNKHSNIVVLGVKRKMSIRKWLVLLLHKVANKFLIE
jgi:hypothetical protein